MQTMRKFASRSSSRHGEEVGRAASSSSGTNLHRIDSTGSAPVQQPSFGASISSLFGSASRHAAAATPPPPPSSSSSSPKMCMNLAPRPFVACCMLLLVQFLERYSYYGLLGNLKNIYKDILGYDEEHTKTVVRAINGFCYVMPMIGGLVADWLHVSKAKMVFGFMVTYAVGDVILACLVSAQPSDVTMAAGVVVVGCGGMKPCIAALGGDQCTTRTYTCMYFAAFYFVTNVGAVLAACSTATLEPTAGTWLNAMLILLATAIFIIGMYFPGYQTVKIDERNILQCFECIMYALKCRVKKLAGKGGDGGVVKKDHWMEYADSKYSQSVIEASKQLVRLAILVIPAPIFWMLVYQQWELWMAEPALMDRWTDDAGHLTNATFLADLNPICVSAMIVPLHALYVPCGLVKLFRNPLQRMMVGGMAVVVAYAFAGFVALEIETRAAVNETDAYLNDWPRVNIFILNGGACDLTLQHRIQGETEFAKFDLRMSTMLYYGHIPLPKEENLVYTAGKGFRMRTHFYVNGPCYNQKEKNKDLYEDFEKGEVGLQIFTYRQRTRPAPHKRHSESKPIMRIFIDDYAQNVHSVEIYQCANNTLVDRLIGYQFYIELPHPGYYDLKVNDKWVQRQQRFNSRATYVITVAINETMNYTIWELLSNDRITYRWLLPQFVLLALGEAMFAVGGIEFMYTQAPPSLACLMQGLWLLMIVIGILLLSIAEVIVEGAFMSCIFRDYAIAMFFDVVVLAVLWWFYKYRHN